MKIFVVYGHSSLQLLTAHEKHAVNVFAALKTDSFGHESVYLMLSTFTAVNQ